MRRRGFSLLLLLLFLLGAIGHIFFRPAPLPEEDYTITLRWETAPALLLSALPKTGAPLKAEGREAILTHTEIRPRMLYGRKERKELSRAATLSATVIFTLSLKAHEREGRLYLGDRMLLLGDLLVLTGQNFRISASLMGAKRLF